MSYKVNVVIEHDEHGYFAYVPELKGCHSQGETMEEVMSNIKEAFELYLETLSKEEVAAMLSKEIYTSTLSVKIA